MKTTQLDQLKIEREPEVESNPKRWPILVFIAVILAAAGYWFFVKPEAAIEIRTAIAREVSSQTASTVLNASGYVTARRQATVSSKFTGKVVEVLIEEGMQVEQDQVLARLDDSNVATGYALAEAQLRAAESSLKETQALLNEARANFKRTLNLVDRGLSSEAEMDRARASSESLAARLERKQADVRVAERQLDVYRQQLEDTIIRAPFAGVVVAKNAQPGEMISPVSAGGGFTRTGIGTIVDMSSLEIEIDVNEAYINRVKPGQKIVATLDAYPDWSIPSHVIAIIPTADRQRATVEVRVGFDQLDSRILPDMGVKVAFQEEGSTATTGRAGVLIPQSAIMDKNGKRYVLLVINGAVERRAVATAGERGKEVLITSGLSGGDKVVLNATANLETGTRVRETSE
ncbi:MAG: efflux RND transporter periplasmic adaptor subunit [Xanthomonadales bacterium]|nr:efflux RND transporter periplasmic adaptor subunit [Xanthomonadales bacterium]MDH4020569.1 efflux RND transporter periplasmic adaptor subunit [Xanthomonadales bacterium]